MGNVVKLLIAAGADPTITTGDGKGLSPADIAWATQHADIADFLTAQEQKHRTAH